MHRTNRSYAAAVCSIPYPIDLIQLYNQWIIRWQVEKSEHSLVNKAFLEQLEQGQRINNTLFSDLDMHTTTSIIQPSLFIFHVSRCGSTLSANYFATDSANRVFNEPLLLGNLFSRPEAQISMDSLRKNIQALGIGALNEQKRLIVKLSSSHLKYIPLFESLFPKVPKWLIIRNPKDVMVSNFENPSRRLFAKMKGLSDSNSVQVVCQYVEDNYAHALRNKHVFSQIIDFSTLKNSLKLLEKTLWTPKVSQKRENLLKQVMSRHSRAQNKTFSNDEIEKQEAWNKLEQKYATDLGSNAISLYTQLTESL